MTERKASALYSENFNKINSFAKGVFFRIFRSESEILMRNVNGQKGKQVSVTVILYH